MSVSDTHQRIVDLHDLNELVQAATPVKRRADLDVETAYVPPARPEESQLAEIWREVLHIDTVGVDDNFFELAGDSLLVTMVLSRIERQFGVNLPIDVFFEAPTVRAIVAALATYAPSSADEAASAIDLIDASLGDAPVTRQTGD